MFTPIEAFLGWRYTRAKRRSHFVSFISAIAMLGVALGVAALITILSIMNGFESELRDRILGMEAHVVVTADSNETKIFLDGALIDTGVGGSNLDISLGILGGEDHRNYIYLQELYKEN